MNIVKSCQYQELGNDCMIGTAVSIIKCEDIFFVVKVYFVDGWAYRREAEVTQPTRDYSIALEDYYRLGGKKD